MKDNIWFFMFVLVSIMKNEPVLISYTKLCQGQQMSEVYGQHYFCLMRAWIIFVITYILNE